MQRRHRPSSSDTDDLRRRSSLSPTLDLELLYRDVEGLRRRRSLSRLDHDVHFTAWSQTLRPAKRPQTWLSLRLALNESKKIPSIFDSLAQSTEFFAIGPNGRWEAVDIEYEERWPSNLPSRDMSTYPSRQASIRNNDRHQARETVIPNTINESSVDLEKSAHTDLNGISTDLSIMDAAADSRTALHQTAVEEKLAGSSTAPQPPAPPSALPPMGPPMRPPGPYTVDWDGPNDLANPMNWTERNKVLAIGIVSASTFVTPLASSIFAPAVPQFMRHFDNSNAELASFIVSVYLLGFTVGPLLLAPLSEIYGRRPLYQAANLFFVVFSVACAVSSDIPMFIVFRFLHGAVGVTPLAIGAGTIADLVPPQKRGKFLAIWALGPLFGPIIGPVAGGYLSQASGWRWVFWLLAIVSGVLTIAGLFFLRETYAPVLLERKAARIRKETGDDRHRSKYDKELPRKEYFRRALVRPTKLLFGSPIVFLFALNISVVYGYLYLLFTTFTFVFEDNYGFSTGAVGLTFLGVGVGMFFGLPLVGKTSDIIYKKRTVAGTMKPECRLYPMVPGAFCIPIGLFWYGWSAHYHTHWIVPIIGTAFVGIGTLATFMPTQAYFIDTFTIYAASATACNTVLRSLFGALLPLAGRSLYSNLGLNWGNSLLAFIALALSPVPFFFLKYGERIRTNPRFQVDL